MRDNKDLTDQELLSRMYSVFTDCFRLISRTKTGSEMLSRIVPNGNDSSVDRVDFLSRKFKDILGYLIIYHCADDEILKTYLFLDLEQFLRRNSQFYWTVALLKSKEYFARWLLDQQIISQRAFFGNICCIDHLRQCWNSIKFRFEKRIRPKRTIRHRGYRDKGTLPALDSKVRREEEQKDCILLEEQIRAEELYVQQTEEIRLLEDYLSGGGTLEETLQVKFRILKEETKT